MRRRGWVLMTALGLAAPALAQEGGAPAREASAEDPLRHPGFGALQWGAPLAAVLKAYPDLKRRTPLGQAQKALRADQVLILEQKVRFRGREWPARLYVDKDGLHRVVVTHELERGPQGGHLDRFLDPLFGSLAAPERSPDGHRTWKGDQTVVTVGTTRLPGAERVEITFDQASRHRPDEEGSLDID